MFRQPFRLNRGYGEKKHAHAQRTMETITRRYESMLIRCLITRSAKKCTFYEIFLIISVIEKPLHFVASYGISSCQEKKKKIFPSAPFESIQINKLTP